MRLQRDGEFGLFVGLHVQVAECHHLLTPAAHHRPRTANALLHRSESLKAETAGECLGGNHEPPAHTAKSIRGAAQRVHHLVVHVAELHPDALPSHGVALAATVHAGGQQQELHRVAGPIYRPVHQQLVVTALRRGIVTACGEQFACYVQPSVAHRQLVIVVLPIPLLGYLSAHQALLEGKKAVSIGLHRAEGGELHWVCKASPQVHTLVAHGLAADVVHHIAAHASGVALRQHDGSTRHGESLHHKSFALEVRRRRHQKHVMPRCQCRHVAVMVVVLIVAHLDRPLLCAAVRQLLLPAFLHTARQQPCTRLLVAELVWVIARGEGDDTVVQLCCVPARHAHQQVASGGTHFLHINRDYRLLYPSFKIGALHAPLALGPAADGAVAIGHSCYKVIVRLRHACQLEIQQRHLLVAAATVAVQTILHQAATVRLGEVGLALHQFQPTQLVVERQVHVATAAAVLHQLPLQFQSPLQRHILHGQVHQQVIHRRGDVEQRLLGLLTERCQTAVGHTAQGEGVRQGGVDIAEEQVAHSAVHGYQIGHHGTKARQAAVHRIFLIAHGGTLHIPCGGKQSVRQFRVGSACFCHMQRGVPQTVRRGKGIAVVLFFQHRFYAGKSVGGCCCLLSLLQHGL